MAAVEGKNKEAEAVKAIQKETTEVVTVQIEVGFEQLLKMVEQLPDTKRIEFLDTLQAQLEEEKLIEPRTDEAQRKQVQKEKANAVMQRFIDQAPNDGEGEELDANLTDRELLEMIKNI